VIHTGEFGVAYNCFDVGKGVGSAFFKMVHLGILVIRSHILTGGDVTCGWVLRSLVVVASPLALDCSFKQNLLSLQQLFPQQ
jgi:hypothetical protein